MPAEYDSLPLMQFFEAEDRARIRMKKAILAALLFLLVLIWVPLPGYTIELSDRATKKVKPPARYYFKPRAERVSEVVIRDISSVPTPIVTDPAPVIEAIEPDPIDESIGIVLTDGWELSQPVHRDRVHPVPEDTVGLERPIVTLRVAPNYPVRGIEIGMQGYVLLEAVMRSDGRIDTVKVIHQLGRGKFGFEQAAIDALRQWQFLPGRLNGQPVDVRIVLRIDFQCH